MATVRHVPTACEFRPLPRQRPLSPRKTPRQGRSQLTYDAIVEAAMRVLSAEGLERFNTNAVAERAGVSIGSLYQYFPDKDVLMAEIIRRDNTRFLDALRRTVDDGSLGPIETLRALVARAVEHQLDDPRLAAIIDEEQRRLPMDADDAALRSEIVDVVARALRRLEPAPADPALAASDLLGIARGLLDTAALEGEDDSVRLHDRLERAAFGYLDIG